MRIDNPKPQSSRLRFSLLRRKVGFSLLEVMVTMTIIALLAAIAIPAFDRIRQSARQGRFISDLRVFASVFQTHVMQHGEWPADAGPGESPPGVDGMPVGWAAPSPLGGVWKWSSDDAAKRILLVNPSATAAEFAKIDSKIDDGDPSGGLFRLDGTSWAYVLQGAP